MSPFSFQAENPYLSDPDVSLMLEFQKGDKASFEKLMERNYKHVFNLTYRFVGTKEAAEDLTQEIFIKVYRAAASYRPKAKFKTWIYQIARNASLNELRRHTKRDISLDETFETEDGQLKREIADTNALTPSQEVIQQETVEEIQAAIQSLPENQRMAVILRRYENLSYEDIAKTMNCSVEAVKSLLNRAKENLKVKLSHLIDVREDKKVRNF